LIYYKYIKKNKSAFTGRDKYLTLQELSVRYGVDIEKLKIFESNNLISAKEFSYNDFNKLGMLCILYNSGLSINKIKKFMSLNDNNSEQIKILSFCRNNLLEEIHEKQKNLDSLDYIIYEIKNKIHPIF